MTMKFTTEASIQIPREELKRTMAICRRPTMSLLRCHKEKETFLRSTSSFSKEKGKLPTPNEGPFKLPQEDTILPHR